MAEGQIGRGRGPRTKKAPDRTAAPNTVRRRETTADSLAREVAAEDEDWKDSAGYGPYDPDDAPPESDYPDYPFDDDEVEPDETFWRHERSTPLPQLSLFVTSDGARRHTVKTIDVVRAESGEVLRRKMLDREAYLDSIGAALALALPAELLLAKSIATAYALLPELTKEVLARASDVHHTELSRNTTMLVKLECGCVPLDFFTWRNPNADAVVRSLAEWPRIREPAGASLLNDAMDVVGPPHSRDTVRMYLKWVQALAQIPDDVAAHHAAFVAEPHTAGTLMESLAAHAHRAAESNGLQVPHPARRGPALTRALAGGMFR